MNQIFRAFPALKSMGENVANFIEGQFSSQKNENKIFDTIFESWSHPEDAGEQNSLLGKLVLEGGFGYKKSKFTLDDLSKSPESGIHPSLLDMLEDETKKGAHEYTVPRTRKPYTHQEEAFKEAKKGNSILVSAGTGSGKTECFLYPIISDILSETPQQRETRGIRAIILYPTNALIHSQEQRLIEYLNTAANEKNAGRPISFCMYNGGLPHCKKNNPSDFYIIRNREDLSKQTPSDQNGIPDIILTNFSMLEYILLRDKDFPLLSTAGKLLPNSNKTVFRHLVLDEAHTYTGANATEIALQIRRVLLAMENAGGTMPIVQFYATSATFSGDDNGLIKFAQGLFFNVDESKISIIKGNRFAPDVPYSEKKEIDLSEDLQKKFLQLNKKEITLNEIYDTFQSYLKERTPDALGQFLWKLEIVKKIREWLCSTDENRSFLFEDLYKTLSLSTKDLSKELVAILLDIGSLAKFTPNNDTEEIPLLPARWHSVFRKFEGLFACVNPNCTAKNCQNHGYRKNFGKIYTTWQEKCDCGAPVYPLSFCNGCGKPYVMVQENDGAPISTPSTKNIIGAFFDINDSEEQSKIAFLSPEQTDEKSKPKLLFPENKFYTTSNTSCSCGYKLPSGDRRKHFTQTFVQNKPLFTSLVLEGLWPHLPEQKNLDHKAWPSNGRHILSFSDTRQNAAQLAPIMENTFFRNNSYQLIKKVLSELSLKDKSQLQQLEDLKDDLSPEAYNKRKAKILSKTPCYDINHIVENITQNKEYLNLLGLVDLEIDKPMQNRQKRLASNIAYILLNLPPQGVSLENAGIIECVYPGLETCEVPAKYANFMNNSEWQDLLYTCLQSIRQRQAFAFDDNNIYKEDFEAYFDFFPDKTCNILSENIQKNIIPKIFGNKARLLLNAPKNGDCELEEKIKDIAFEKGWINSKKQIYWEMPDRASEGQVHPIQFRLRQDSSLFRCRETQRVVFKNIKQQSPYSDKGIEEVPIDNLYSRLHKIVSEDKIYSCFAAEHTAQSDVKENQKIEEEFRQNKLNLLSSTTTMEMGIDVGALSSIMLANTPPTQANYMQRAGRAGRRGEGSSLIFTICNASPHDEMFYHSPDWAFKKSLSSPEISFKSRTLLQRAVNAWLVRCICQNDQVLKDLEVGNSPTEVYSTYGKFFNKVKEEKCLDWLHGDNLLHNIHADQNHPMRKQIKMLLDRSPFFENFDFSSEASLIGNSIKRLNQIIGNWSKGIADLQHEIENFDSLHREESEKWRYTVKTKCQNEVDKLQGKNADPLKDSTISYLVSHQYFPSHGLPLDVVALNVMTPTEKKHDTVNDFYVENNTFKLTRNRASAIRSYAPGNETVVQGNRYMSLGIMIDYRQRFGLKPNEDRSNQIMQTVYTCPKCKVIFTERPSNEICPHCSNEQKTYQLIPQNVIKPEAFVTNTIKKQGFKKGVRNPIHARQIVHTQASGEFTAEKNSSFATTKLSTSCHIHTFNEGLVRGFKYCQNCFRVIDATENTENDTIAPARRFCPGLNKKHYWSKPFYLYHSFVTEALMIKIQKEFLISKIPIAQKEKAANALGISIKRAACTILGIEEKEIDYNLPTAEQSHDCDVILYDTNTGGSGIIQLIESNIDNIIAYAINNILIGDIVKHHSICKGACPQCLISYSTQFLFNDETKSPDRFALLNSLDFQKIQNNESYNKFKEYKTQNNITEETMDNIKTIVETAPEITIVVPHFSSDILDSYLWHTLRRRLNTNDVKILTTQIKTDDELFIAKEICKRITNQTIGVLNQDIVPGIYIQRKFYGQINWESLKYINPFDEDEINTVWIQRNENLIPTYNDWQIPVEVQKINRLGGETTTEDGLSCNKIEKLMNKFIDCIGKPNDIDFSTATSWVYTDNYALRKTGHKKDFAKQAETVITKEACTQFLIAIGAGHLLKDKHLGKIEYSASDLANYHGIKISWIDIAEEDGEHRKEDIHDRFLRINFSNSKQYVLSLGKGFSAFIQERNLYKKQPGSYSWYIRENQR